MDEPRTRWEKAYVRAGARHGERVFARLAAAPSLEPSWTASKGAAALIAVATHLLTLALVAAGAVCLVQAPGNPLLLVFAAIALGLAWLMRPRLGRPPREDVVSREHAPELYRLADEVAAALEVRGPDCIVVDDDFNAWWWVAGVRRRRVLGLGLPLFDVLEGRERVAVVAHELAHARNGDARRGLLVGSSVGALSELYAVIGPGDHAEDTGAGGLDVLVHGVLWLLSRPIAAVLALQAHLLLYDSRRAEFLADALAARVAGTAATVALHEKLLAGPALAAATRRALHRDGDVDLFADARHVLLEASPEEREARRRAAREEDARLDATHPPTAQRLALLEAREPLPAQVVLDQARSDRIDRELAARHAPLQARILDAERARHYAAGRATARR